MPVCVENNEFYPATAIVLYKDHNDRAIYVDEIVFHNFGEFYAWVIRGCGVFDRTNNLVAHDSFYDLSVQACNPDNYTEEILTRVLPNTECTFIFTDREYEILKSDTGSITVSYEDKEE